MTGQELQKWRIDNKLTQQALADVLGIHRVTVAKWEIGMEPIPKYITLALAGLKKQR